MKIYLDDTRNTPDGWTRCFWPEEVIALLKNPPEPVTELSLDHDLGDDERTGYDVLKWIEEQVYTTNFVPPPEIHIHSDNVGAWPKMKAAIQQIKKVSQQRQNNSQTL